MKLWTAVLSSCVVAASLSACSHTNTQNTAPKMSNVKKQNLVTQCREINRQLTNVQGGLTPSDTPAQRNNTIMSLRREYNTKGCAGLN